MNQVGTLTLETKRLRLRQMVMMDAFAMFHNWANDPQVTKYLTWNPHQSIETTQEIIKSWSEQYASSLFFHWAIVYCPTHELVGNISLFKVDPQLKTGELGYCMSAKYWNCGIMSEAVWAVLSFAFNTVGFNEIEARHDINNPASGRVMQKNKMTKIGNVITFSKKESKDIELCVYRIKKEEFL
ncbi:MAG: GNAT family N-acetyltransferase [Bacilli bacterium]